MQIQSLDGRTVKIDNQTYLYFSGTSYLGISTHPLFQQYLVEGIALYGANYGGSRLSNLKFEVFETTEQLLAKNTNMEAALTLSSGTFAGQLLSQELAKTHQLSYAPKTHPALWHVPQKKVPKAQEQWIENILKSAKNSKKPLAILCNAIDPLYAQAQDFSWWKLLPNDRKTIVVLDDSHGIGVVGECGMGIASILDIPKQVELMISSSLGKSYAIAGGVILGARKRIELLKKNALFGGASPIIPAYLYAFLKAQKLYQLQLQKLRNNIAQLENYLKTRADFQFIDQYPVFYTSNQRIRSRLLDQGIFISSFPYPTPQSDCINRIIVSAAQQEDDISKLIMALKTI